MGEMPLDEAKLTWSEFKKIALVLGDVKLNELIPGYEADFQVPAPGNEWQAGRHTMAEWEASIGQWASW